MAADQEVKLLGIVGSPFVTRVEVALKLKGVEYEYVPESLTNKSDLLLKSNPVHKKVPVLLHNGKSVSESLVIVEYVDETWKGYPILPSDPHQRALARFWSKFIDDKLFPAIFKVAFNLVERENGIEESLEALQFLENEVKDKKFFGGDVVRLVDITALFIIAFWLPVIEEAGGFVLLASEKFPNLHKWSQEILNHPVVKEALPPREYLLAFFKPRFASLTA